MCDGSQRGIYSPPTVSSVLPCSATFLVPPPPPPPPPSLGYNNSHTIVLVLSVTCEHILMSPHFFLALPLRQLAATCQPARISSSAIISSLSPPRLITVPLLSLSPSVFFFSPLLFFFFSSRFLCLKEKKEKKSSLSALFIYFFHLAILFFCSPSTSHLSKLRGSSFFTVLFPGAGLDSYFLCESSAGRIKRQLC